ncbi:MAG: bifunctional ornithine acetyltransferase/N-acetylglutamate synthase, partial [Candidatus Omnitrophica bacterium]|nr:bifunctional ornithine acetyltransferase/N-acetylglutamate synthase [Candidatus Omnitrophota bacterium]
MKFYKKAILPLGFEANALSAGIKKNNKLDLALFYSAYPAKVAGVFTSNRIQANPIKLDKMNLKRNKAFQALIVNSGNANCFTGENGFRDCLKITKELAKHLNIRKESILLSSTGIIGKPLPIKKILNAIPLLVRGLSRKGIDKAKRAILTTDTFTKEITCRFNLGKSKITICGVAKGAGMVSPNLATMLCFIFTDLNITKRALDKVLKLVVQDTFNCISIDG